MSTTVETPAVVLSEKQARSIRDSVSRLNWWVGGVRSGKTVSSSLRWCQYVGEEAPLNGILIMAGKTLSTIVENVLEPLAGYIGYDNVVYQRKSPEAYILGRRVLLFGASDVRSETKLRGLTSSGAYLDEVTLLEEEFVMMLLSRLSVEGAKLFGTTNADSPHHWLKRNILDNPKISQSVFNFVPEDNPSLSPEFIESLRNEWTGVWRKRFIEGLWTAAAGSIYSEFGESSIIDECPVASDYVVGADYGITNPCAFVLLGINRGTSPSIWVEREYYYNSQETGRQKTDDEYVTDFRSWIGGTRPSGIYIDPSASSLKLSLQRAGYSQIYNPVEKSVVEGIQTVSGLLSNSQFKIHRSCTNLIKEMYSYSWDQSAQRKGEDRPKKINDHLVDAVRYAVSSRVGRGTLDYSLLSTLYRS